MSEDFDLIREQRQPVEEGRRPKMKVCIVAAIGENNELGKNNQLLWHLSEDMQFFKEVTTGYYVIMGRKSFESIPPKYRPLPERVNVIISRDPEYMAEECYTCTSLKEALSLPEENGEPRCFLIGGGQIFQMAFDENLVDEMYITHVHASFPDAEVFFPKFDESQWTKKHIMSVQPDSRNEFAFDIYAYEKNTAGLNPESKELSEGQIPN